MSDQVDSGGNVQEESVSQTQPSGQTPVSQNNSPAAADVAKAILADPAFQETMRRLSQSEKDRGVARAEAKAEEAITQLQRLAQKLGASPEQAKQVERDMILDQLVQSYVQGQQPTPQSVSRELTPEEARARASSVLGGVPQEIRDAVLKEVGSRAFESADDITKFVISQVTSKASKPAATQANTSIPSGNAPVPTSMQELIRQREAIMESREFTTAEGRRKLGAIGKQMEELEKGES